MIRLTQKDRRIIKSLYNKGLTLSEIAPFFGVSHTRIKDILDGFVPKIGTRAQSVNYKMMNCAYCNGEVRRHVNVKKAECFDCKQKRRSDYYRKTRC